jgi:hypothetical protein
MGLRFLGPVVFIRPLETHEAVELANASLAVTPLPVAEE